MFCSSRRRHTVYWRDWISDVCSSDLEERLDEGDRPLVHAQLIRVRDAAREQQRVELRRVGLRERHVHRKEIARVVVLPARDLLLYGRDDLSLRARRLKSLLRPRQLHLLETVRDEYRHALPFETLLH